jgi:hypothetical protein
MELRVTDPSLIKAAFELPNWQELTAQKPGLFPEAMTGKMPGLIGKSLVGAGLGYLSSYPLSWMNKDIDRSKAKKVLPLLGAGAMAAWSLPQVMTDAPSVGWSPWSEKPDPAYEAAIQGSTDQSTGNRGINTTLNTARSLQKIAPQATKPMIRRASYDGTCSINDVYSGLEKLSGFFGDYSPPQPGQLGLPGSPLSYGGISPYTPGMGVIGGNQFGIGQALNTVLTDTTLSPTQRVVAIKSLTQAAQGDGGGLISTKDLIRGAVGAGVGYGAATLFGKTLGAVFGLPAQTQQKLSRIGAVGGLLNGLGILKY